MSGSVLSCVYPAAEFGVLARIFYSQWKFPAVLCISLYDRCLCQTVSATEKASVVLGISLAMLGRGRQPIPADMDYNSDIWSADGRDDLLRVQFCRGIPGFCGAVYDICFYALESRVAGEAFRIPVATNFRNLLDP